MILVRTGPRFLFLSTGNKTELKQVLAELPGASLMDFYTAVKTAGESNTIIFISGKDRGEMNVESAKTFMVTEGSSVVLAELINRGLVSKLEGAELGPGLILQRVPRGAHKVIETVREYYDALPLTLEEAINNGKAGDTVVVFTDRPLSKIIRIEDVMSPVLLVNKSVPVTYRELRQEAVRHFTLGLESGEWYEVRINLYDRDERYDIQYRRVVLALEDLDAGLILREAWSRDHALALFSVLAYQVKLFTPLEPLELKKTLMGLEFDSEGNRFLDIDLYHRRKKIEKGDIFKHLSSDVGNYGKYFRNRLFERLSRETVEKILDLEQELDSSEQ